MSQGLSNGQSIYAVLVMLLIAALAASSWWERALASSVMEAQEQLDECLRAARQIALLRDAPDRAEEHSRGHGDLAQEVERWSRIAGIDLPRILSVDPLTPRRFGDSDYLEQGAEVEFSRVTLAQLAELADQIATEDRRLRLSDLRLQAPRDEATDGQSAECWNAEIALTYLLYSPKSSPR